MSHRWPGIYDRNSQNIDIIVAGSHQSQEKLYTFGIQYSDSNLVHVRIVNTNNNVSPGSLHILLCDDSMLISNGLCIHGHTMCDEGTCILSHYVCDGRADCPDGSDEMECSHVCCFSENYSGNFHSDCLFSCVSPKCLCNDLYFSCPLGGCVPWSRVCDGVHDCPQGDDEERCYFTEMDAVTRALFIAHNFNEDVSLKLKVDDYQCINGSNISHTLVNDLVADCPEQDDEETYYAFLKNGSRTDFFNENVLCKQSDTTTCVKNYRGVCYPRHLHCINEVVNSPNTHTQQRAETCRNGAHLNNCELYTCPSFFKCPSAYCIPVYGVCNGRIECPNGEDEKDCHKMSCPGFLLCRDDNRCVHPNDMWSGSVKCPVSIDDKAFQDASACPTHCECLGNAIKCNLVEGLRLPTLQATIRMLVITNTLFSLDDIAWKADLITLLYLKLSFCKISSVKTKHFTPLRFLQTLHLRNNVIPSLSKGVFQSLSNVKEIDLGHNLISHLHPAIFRGASKLHILKVDSNKLSSVESCIFDELHRLTILDLSNNFLTSIGDNVFCLNHQSSLRELYIGNNRISFIKKAFFASHMQNLTHLNITPLQICCFVAWVHHCFPKDNFYLSTCRSLLGSAFRYGLLISGIFVLFINICCSIWILQRILQLCKDKTHSGNTSTNLNNILNLTLFICHGIKGIHMITLVCVDIVFYGQYALYEQMWKSHPLCVILNMCSYTLLLGSIFVLLLTNYMRMIACVYPFKLANVSASPSIWAIIIFLFISLGIGYIQHSGITGSHVHEPQMALGFGLILPMIMHDHYAFSLLGYVTPVFIMLCVSSAFQVACIRTLSRRSQTLNQHSKTLPHRRRSVIRCITILMLPLCCHMPLLLLHVASMFGTQFSAQVTLSATALTLLVYSIVSAILYVVITPDFISYTLGSKDSM